MSINTNVIDLYHEDTVDPENGFHDIKSSGVLGVIHKATQGIDFTDGTYNERRLRALSVGLLWGSYHFGVSNIGPGGDGKAQAAYYLSVINPMPEEIMVLDFEINPSNPTKTMTIADAQLFVQHVYTVTGRYPLLYSNLDFLKQQFADVHTGSVLLQCALWIADYNDAPPQNPVASSEFVLWQFTNGTIGLNPPFISGVGYCDCDQVMNGSVLNILWDTTVFK